MEKRKTDLRVIKTKQAIRNAFCEMITEMDYQSITVKELVSRAMINRNTFYLHYASIDKLLEELQNEIADDFITIYSACDSVEDIHKMVRRFIEYITSQSELFERIFCSGSYRFIAERINEKIMLHRRQNRNIMLGENEAADNIVFSYCGSTAALLFRQWVSDGKKLSVDELSELATKLICNGMESFIAN